MLTNNPSAVPDASVPLRERKKQKLRREMIEVSQRLFAANGFSATTLEQICDELDIRPQTLLRYFESKAHLALAETFEVLEDFRAAVQAPDRTVAALDLWRDLVVTQATPHTAAMARWVLAEPLLVDMYGGIQSQLERTLARGLATDAGAEPDDVFSEIVAAALVGGSAAVFQRWLRRGGKGEFAPDQRAVVDWVAREFDAKLRRSLDRAIGP